MKSSFCTVVTGQSLITRDLRSVRDAGFRTVAKFIQRGDVAFTNFESTILGRFGGWPTKGKYMGYSPPEVLDALKSIGFNALSLSNNHAFDLGPSGVLSTIEEAERRGFLHAGTGVDETQARTPGVMALGGREVSLVAMDAGPGPANMYAANRCAFRPSRPGVNQLKTLRRLGVPPQYFDSLISMSDKLRINELELANYAQPHDPPDIRPDLEVDLYGTIFTRAAQWERRVEIEEANALAHLGAIRDAAKQGSFVIAYLHHHHWAPNWQDAPSWVQAFARRCVDAGAKIFVSHGAPALQAIEIYQGVPIFYGLGNFIFHTDDEEDVWSPPEVWQSVVAACDFDGSDDLVSIDLMPIVIEVADRKKDTAVSVPRQAKGEYASHILTSLAYRSREFGTSIEISGSSGRITA